MVDRFAKLAQQPIKVSPERLIFGKFRYSTQFDSGRTHVHFDKVSWAAIVYLSLDQHCKGGLGIYRHKQLGLDRVPETMDELAILGCNSLQDFDEQYVFPITKETSCWELIQEIPIKYNRMIMIRGGKYFHGITTQFGTTIDNSRLTQTFFFNT